MANKDLIYLVNAGNDKGMASISNDHSFPALGVLSLGTWLKYNIPDIEVVVRDGGIIENEKIIKEINKLKPGIVGVSVLSTSYQNSLEIAQHAKESGAYTIFGNDHASQLSKKILEKRPYVDFVLGSEYGEKPLELLVRSLRGENIDYTEIPDLTYRTSTEDIAGFDYNKDKNILSITSSPLYNVKNRKNALDIFPIVDRTLYPVETHWKKYLENYLSRFSKLHDEEVTGVTTMNRARGCSRAKNNMQCSFCDMLLDISLSSPEKFWKEVKEAYRQVKANVFYEVCDSFSSFPYLIKEIVKTKPDLDFNPKFFVYAQARDIVNNPELIEYFKEIGVFRVNIGLESGSNKTLKHLKSKYDSVETNYKALQMLHDAGIHVYGSFVLGSDAETPETLRETVEWAKKIIREGLITDVEAQPILPLPQNKQGKKLKESGLLPEELQHTDWPWDTDTISQIYIDNFSGVNYKEVLEATKEIREYAKQHGLNYGSGVSREEKYRNDQYDQKLSKTK